MIMTSTATASIRQISPRAWLRRLVTAGLFVLVGATISGCCCNPFRCAAVGYDNCYVPLAGVEQVLAPTTPPAPAEGDAPVTQVRTRQRY